MGQSVPPPNETGSNQRSWKDVMFRQHVDRLWWIKIAFWFHGPTLIAGFLWSSKFAATNWLPARMVPSLLLSFTPILFSLPLLFNCILYKFSTATVQKYGKPAAIYMAIVGCVLVTSFATLTASNAMTLYDLRDVPRNHSIVVYPDRSAECVGYFIYFLTTLISILSFLDVAYGFMRLGTTNKFLTAIGWNGKYLRSKYDVNLSSESAWVKCRSNETFEYEMLSITSYLFIGIITIGASMSFYSTSTICRNDECSKFLKNDFVFIVAIWLCAVVYFVRSDLDKDKFASTTHFAIISVLLAIQMIYSNSTNVLKMVEMIRGFGSKSTPRWSSPRYPFVNIIPRYDSYGEVTLFETPELNETGEAARLSLNLIWFLIKLTGICQLARLFLRARTIRKNRELDISETVV